MKVNIFDILGSYCGMHYYDMAFADVLRSRGHDVEIYSDFAETKERDASFKSFFGCGKLIGILRLFVVYFKFVCLLVLQRKERIVYLTYGEMYEIPFLLAVFFSRNVFVDVHEIHALKYRDGSFVSLMFEWIYNGKIHNVIYHSERTAEKLKGRVRNMVYVPHFRYVFKKTYDENKLGQDVEALFKTNKIKFLFFGNLSVVKGADIVVEIFSSLNGNRDFELVIAGKNVDKLDFSELRHEGIGILDRHINDDEMVYLYSHTDYVLLPYRKSSQSGIFAMSAYFHKPMILSDIAYFKKMIEEYPSFGEIASINDFPKLVSTIIMERGTGRNYYSEFDCGRFDMNDVMDVFVKQITQ